WLSTAAPEHQALRPFRRTSVLLPERVTRACGGSAAHMPHVLPDSTEEHLSSAMIARASVWPSYNLHRPKSWAETLARLRQRSSVRPPPGSGRLASCS